MKKFLSLGLLGFLFLCGPLESDACTIPVFRYALENWELGNYEVLIFHRGPLAADLEASVKKWNAVPLRANIEITTLEVTGKMTPEQRQLWEREGKPDEPAWMLVRQPSAGVNERSAWSGPCTAGHLEGVLSSPLRQTILGHLARGTSIVFVLLTSDDDQADVKSFERVTRQLAILEKRIKLPVQSDDGPKMRLPLPLKVALPLLVLDRKDPAEAALMRLLLATEEDLDKEKGPILFPLFGRGRVLPCLYGENFNEEFVYNVTDFLCKDCSCQVKKLSPGVDLLMEADWNHLFDQMFEGKEAAPVPSALFASLPKRLAPLMTKAPPAPAVSAVPSIPTPMPAPAPGPQTDWTSDAAPALPLAGDVHFWLWLATGVAAGLVAATAVWMVSRLRK